ncbi:MAG: DNA-binding response regulator [Gemmatimonadales bacterium]
MHVLILDDHEMVAEAIADTLRTRGHDVSLAASQTALCEWLELGSIQALVLDVRLGQLDGLAMLSTVRGNYPNLPVVVVTGFDCQEVRERSTSLGVLAVLDKGLSLDYLCAALDGIGVPDDGRRHSILVPRLRLSARKVELLQLLADGLRAKEIAARLGLQRSTVAEYIGWLERRLGAATPGQLIAQAFRHGFIVPLKRSNRAAERSRLGDDAP